ncbi:hypothetical protein ACLUWS_05595 [Bifidobacterium boum]|uniref:hypothetical protein n=2 Tax=Bifidobacterium TaxID=1678 RepID=UPI003991ACE0
MVRVEGPFTLLSPREMDGLRALGVDLEHCRRWVVGDGGEALLADTSGGEWLPGIWGRDFYPVYAFVWRGVLLLANIDWKGGDDGSHEYDVYALSRPDGLPADWYKARFGDVGLLGETVDPDMEMLQVLAAMLRVQYRGWLSYGGVWPEGVIWEDVDRSGLKVREGGLVGPWDVPLTRYRGRVPSDKEYEFAAGLSPEGFARQVKPGRAVMIDDAGRSVLWGIPVIHNPHGGGSGTMGGFIYDGAAYGWREVREAFARPVGERRVNARHVFFNRGRDWYEPDVAFLRAYWDAGYACKLPLRLTYRGVSIELPEILPGGSPA